MNQFANQVVLSANRTFTENGAATLKSSTNTVLDLFYTIGASRGKDIIPLFEKAVAEDRELAVRVALWARDVRQGAGERQLFRDILRYLEANDFEMFKRVVLKVPELGRWDDMLAAQTKEGFAYVAEVYFNGIMEEYAKFGSSTASKWAPRKGEVANRLRKEWTMTPKEFRKFIVSSSQTVEQLMCSKDFASIELPKVPSLAMARYTKAFNKHIPEKFLAYKEALKSGEAKVNASAVYPYDVIKTVDHGDKELANEQWKALPNYLGEDFVLPMIDVSGSMSQALGKTLNVMDVAVALGLYVADKQTGPFAGLSLTFSANPTFQNYRNDATLADKVYNCRNAEWGMNTDIQKAFEAILELAIRGKVPQSDMPKYLLVLSDMEFDEATRTYGHSGVASTDTMFETAGKLFKYAGYELPNIVFWNLASRNKTVPVTFDQRGTALVSGFSPSIMKAVLGANLQNFNPINIMLDTINNTRYDF